MKLLENKKILNIIGIIIVLLYFVLGIIVLNERFIVNLLSTIIISFTFTGSVLLLLYFVSNLLNNNNFKKISKLLLYIQFTIILFFSIIKLIQMYNLNLVAFINTPGTLESLLYIVILVIIIINLTFIFFIKNKQIPIKINTMLILIIIMSILGFIKTSFYILELGNSGFIYLYLFISFPILTHIIFKNNTLKNRNKKEKIVKKLDY